MQKIRAWFYNGLIEKWNIKEDENCKDEYPRLRSVDEYKLTDEK